jgi:hypothetical protein
MGRYSPRSFKQEWDAEFMSDGAGVFRNVRALSKLQREAPVEGRRYIIGVDWGRSHDYTVLSVWDLGTAREVYLDYFTDVPYQAQYGRVQALAEKYNNALVIAEANNAQDAHVEALAARGVRVMPFFTLNAPKAFAVDQLATACERAKAPIFQEDDRGILEMEVFESSRTATGLVRYAAPEGQFDDIPMGRVIAYSAIADSGPVCLGSE